MLLSLQVHKKGDNLMAKLNQIVALVAGKKTRQEKALGDLNKTLQKTDLFNGIQRVYSPIEEGGETLPSEVRRVQQSVEDVLDSACAIWTDVMDTVATQEASNCTAEADVFVDGALVLKNVPVTVLLYIEKQLNDMNTLVGNIPVLDPSVSWMLDANTSQFVAIAPSTHRTKKVNKPIVLYPATPEHPAQTQLVVEDVLAGHWATTLTSTAMTSVRKQELLGRISRLIDAVRTAREQANSQEAVETKIAQPLLDYVFKE